MCGYLCKIDLILTQFSFSVLFLLSPRSLSMSDIVYTNSDLSQRSLVGPAALVLSMYREPKESSTTSYVSLHLPPLLIALYIVFNCS